MKTKSRIIEELLEPGVVAIIRADSSDGVLEAIGALSDGGVRAIEVTLTTPNALEIITAAARKFDRVLIGAGSVLDEASAERAFAAGAEYIVTPTIDAGTIGCCNRREKPVLCGAYTPTEAQQATVLGADFIKIFPAEQLGVDYIRAIRAPLPHLKLVPTGGVDLANCGDYICAGAVAVAVGGALVNRENLQKKAWAAMTKTAAAFVAAVAAARQS